MSIRKRTWTTKNGLKKEAWVVDYVDQHGKRHLKTFERKKEADAYEASVKVDVRQGTHTPDSASITVAEAGELWITGAEKSGLERTTVDAYRQHLRLHISPFLGRTRLSQLSAPMMRQLEDKLRHGVSAAGSTETRERSPAMTKKILGSLGALLADAQENGLVARNVVRDLRSRRRRGKERRQERRQKGKLKIGVDVPTREEIKAIISAADGRWRPLLQTAVFTGLRASELRGLRWIDVDLTKGEIHVRQRADRYRVIGKLKSEAGERTVPIPPLLQTALREWKLACPKAGQLGLVFPNGAGNIEFHVNIINRAWLPAQIAGGVCTLVKDAEGNVQFDGDCNPIRRAKYTGLHALRHFYASWCINRKIDGGLELPAKVVQERLGHSSITVTLDTYGHLFPRGDDTKELADAERMLLG
jgi:integrase